MIRGVAMDVSFLLRGLVVGFSIAAPVGPIGVLCIRRTLVDGRAAGLAAGLGAATADALYGAVAAFGLTAVSGLLARHEGWLRLIGGAFLCYLGLRAFLARPSGDATRADVRGLAATYASTFVLTLTNPMTILSFAAIFAGLGVVGVRGSYASAAVLVVGVFLGSALWWLILSGGVGAFRAAVSPRGLAWVNRLSGVILAGFGLVVLLG